MGNPTSSLSFPLPFRAMPPQPGYQAAHAHFVSMRSMLLEQIRNIDKVQAVIVKVQMMTHIPGRVKASLVSVRSSVPPVNTC
jgi:hypothetical protein